MIFHVTIHYKEMTSGNQEARYFLCHTSIRALFQLQSNQWWIIDTRPFHAFSKKLLSWAILPSLMLACFPPGKVWLLQ
jgi:hypothetical protein